MCKWVACFEGLDAMSCCSFIDIILLLRKHGLPSRMPPKQGNLLNHAQSLCVCVGRENGVIWCQYLLSTELFLKRTITVAHINY